MKSTLRTTIFIFTITATLAWANHHDQDHHGAHAHHHTESNDDIQISSAQGASCQNTIGIQVNGLVCDFCARALEKVVGKREDVSGIDIDLGNSKVTIAMKEGKTIEDDKLKKLITDSGYNVVNIDRGC